MVHWTVAGKEERGNNPPKLWDPAVYMELNFMLYGPTDEAPPCFASDFCRVVLVSRGYGILAVCDVRGVDHEILDEHRINPTSTAVFLSLKNEKNAASINVAERGIAEVVSWGHIQAAVDPKNTSKDKGKQQISGRVYD